MENPIYSLVCFAQQRSSNTIRSVIYTGKSKRDNHFLNKQISKTAGSYPWVNRYSPSKPNGLPCITFLFRIADTFSDGMNHFNAV
ncbi:hypothetical protein D0T90_08740 [Neisseria animalis]|uniref:Uncharacterized protein n=1 Tax=Neisseria animalis TaxID=492 RepID=A0A5P3MV50_NEIAN|nr:hypothetical protein D0T90_08740 [Neisseria animalis]